MKQKNPIVLFFAWLGLAAVSAHPVHAADASASMRSTAAQGTLTGVVTNSATGRALEGARVVMQGTGREVTTDRQGIYRFTDVAPGNVVLSVSYTGLTTSDVSVPVSAGAPTNRDVGLTADIYTLSKFVVSGEREGNAQAITLQRLSQGVKSIVSSDAFGGLAGNPADLAARLPGVEGVYVGGDVRFLIIRGLSRNLTTITQDGNRVADAASGGTTREYHFQTVGADSMERMEIVKSPTPDMDGDSIGGAVNMVTKSAFDSSPERRIRAGIGAIWRATDSRDKARPNYSLSYSEVFAGKFGVALNMAYRPHASMSDEVYQDHEQLAAGVVGPAYMSFLEMGDYHFTRTRSGSGLKLDYKLSENTRFFANWQYNKHIEHAAFVDGGSIVADISTGNAVATRDAAGNFTGTGGIIPGYTDTITQVRAVPSSQIKISTPTGYKEGETSTITVGGVHRYQSLNIDYDAYSSKSKANYAGNNNLGFTLKNIGFTFNRQDPLFPTVVQTAGPDWTNLANYTDNTYQTRRMAGWDEYIGTQLNVKKQFETVVPTYIKAGYRLRDQTRDVRNTTMNYIWVGPDGVMGPNPATGINDDNLAQFGQANRSWPNNKLSRYPKLPFPHVQGAGTIHNILDADPRYLRENTAGSNLQNALTSNQNFKENIHSYYMMGSVDLGKLSILGGVRVEKTDTEGEGALQLITPEEKARRAAWVGTVTDDESRRRIQEEFGRRQTRSGSYRTLFPGLHFKYSPVPQLVTRLSYATNIGRPSIGQLIPRTNVNLDNRTVSSSNPSLKPQYANNFDLSAEYYFEPAGEVSVGVFMKEIKDFIYTTSSTIGSGTDNGFNGDYAGYAYTTQFNGGFGRVKGIEINYSQQFTFLPGWLNGFGAYGNVTRLQAEGNYGSGGAISLTPSAKVAGFNPFIINAGISYIRDRLSLRVSLNHGDRYLTSYNANEARASYNAARTFVNVKTGYRFSKNFDAYVDVVNVTTEPETISEYGYGRITGVAVLHPQFFFGVNWRN